MHASDIQGLNAGLLGSICIIHTLYYYCIIIAIYLNNNSLSLSLSLSLNIGESNELSPLGSFGEQRNGPNL